MRKREVRDLYRVACNAYRQGIVDAAKYAEYEQPSDRRMYLPLNESSTTRLAYEAGWRDARQNTVKDDIDLGAWQKVLAIATHRWAHCTSRYSPRPW